MAANGRREGERRGVSVSRRASERVPAGASALTATWLANWQIKNGNGTLLDISPGGFGARMPEAPPRGRLLHARLTLDAVPGQPAIPVEADAVICAREEEGGEANGYTVHLAIESIHLADERRMQRAIELFKAARS